MDNSLEDAVNQWHDAVNTPDLRLAIAVVTNPNIVFGPKGAGPISDEEFADWIVRSGIRLKAKSWHPISNRLMVVEQDAIWPENKKVIQVATLFRSTQKQISAALRFPNLKSALEFAFIYRELASTE